jgi:5-bromo-4-chloroindolyl phosphate hydrolysis protein
MNKKTSSKSTWMAVLAGIGAVAVLYAGLILLARIVMIPFFWPLLIAVLGFIIFLSLRSSLGKRERAKAVAFEGVTYGDLELIASSGKKYTAEMRSAINRLGQTDIRFAVNDICNISDSIMGMLRDDPRDLRIVKQFITYYLEPTHKIILKYAELATARPMPADAVATLERTEKSLANIRMTFLQQKDKMLANDAMDLDTEIKVFESTSGTQAPKGPEGKSDKANRSYPGN